MIDYITQEEWDKLPAPQPKVNDRTATLLKHLDELEQGKIIKFSGQDEKGVRGLRISLARLASSRGYQLEFRSSADTLVVRKGGAKPPKAETSTPRKSKKTAETQV
jgi:hypothetical protein